MQSETSVVKINTDLIVPNKYQPRKVFDEKALTSLADSIKQYGILNPILVRKKDDKYEIIAGERRFRAAKQLGLTEVPVIVKNADEQQMAELALIENLERQNLSAIEEAKSYEEIMRIGNQTQESLAKKLGKSQSTIANKIRLLSLPIEIQEALSKQKISERHARSLISVNDEEKQINLLNRIITEKLTVKETEQLINEKEFTEKEMKDALDDIVQALKKVNEPIEKEEKEDDNMNNGNFFPNFENNTMNNNTSLNMMNEQTMNQPPLGPVNEMVMPTMNQPMATPPLMVPEQPMPQPMMDMPMPTVDNQMINPTMMTEPMVPTPPVENNPIPDFGQFGAVPSMDQNSGMNMPEQVNSPMMDTPLFNPDVVMPTVDNQIVNPTVMPEPMVSTTPLENNGFEVPITMSSNNMINNPAQTNFTPSVENKLLDLQNYLSSNGYSFKTLSNDDENCIIIELPKNY